MIAFRIMFATKALLVSERTNRESRAITCFVDYLCITQPIAGGYSAYKELF